MKKFYYTVCMIICLSTFLKTFAQCSGGGELLIGFTGPTNLTFDLEITTDQYCWDGASSGYSPIANFQYSDEGLICMKFTNPGVGGSARLEIYWGIFDFTIIVRDGTTPVGVRRFRLNLKDENWATFGEGTGYPGVDTFVRIDATNPNIIKFTLVADQNGYYNSDALFDSSYHEIWSL